jgi:hypothetical protein
VGATPVQHRRAAGHLGLEAAAALLVPAATATAAETVYSPSNAAVATADDLDVTLDQVGALRCPRRAALPRPAAPAAAIRNAWKALGRLERSSALRAFRRSKANRSAAAIPASVITGVATGRPGAALAASLRGAELEPRQQRHLVNAAVLLLGYGRTKEANDLLAAAARLRASGAPFGIGGAAALTAAQGEVALAAGRFASAERSYRSAARQAPLLAEARLGVAHALKCQGKRAPAARWLRRGQRRTDKVEPGRDGDPEPAVTVEDLADPAAARDIVRFGSYHRASSPVDAAGYEASYKSAHESASARALALGQQADAAFPVSSPLYFSRAASRWGGYVAARIEADPEMRRLDAETTRLQQEWLDLTGLIESRPVCYYSTQHAKIWDLHARRAANYEALARRYHRLLTSLAAGMGIPEQSRQYNLRADAMVALYYTSLTQLVYYTARTEAHEVAMNPMACGGFGSPGGGGGENAAEDASPASDPCKVARVERLKIKFGSVVSAELNCEGGKVEVVPAKWGIDQAYVGAFGEVGVKWKNGDVTAVTGVKGSIGTDGITGLPTVSVGAKAGVYVTAGRGKGLPEFGGGSKTTWTVKDYGVRVQSSAEIPGGKLGPVATITKFDDKVDISLVGVFGSSE